MPPLEEEDRWPEYFAWLEQAELLLLSPPFSCHGAAVA